MKSPFLFLFFIFLIGIPFISAADFTFQVNEQFNLRIPCFNNGTYCSGAAVCNSTILYPDGDLMITDADMTAENSFFNITITKEQNNVLGEHSIIMVCCEAGDCGSNTHTLEITADGFQARQIPFQFLVVVFGFLLIGLGLMQEKLRIFKHSGAMLVLIMGVLTLYPGYSFINWTTLLGKALGVIFIGLGFYFLIEGAFSRERQVDHFNQADDGRFHG